MYLKDLFFNSYMKISSRRFESPKRHHFFPSTGIR